MNNIVMFGAGNRAKEIIKEIRQYPDLYVGENIVFCDNNPDLWGKTIAGKQIIPPQNIKSENTDLIVISSIYEKEIRRQLIQELNIDSEKILLYSEFRNQKFSHMVYGKKYGNIKKSGLNILETKNIIVYTAITGKYDDLKEPEYTGKNITYVCYTDNHAIKSKNWNIEYIEKKFDSVYLAKDIKLKPHIYCKDFETSIWVDGSFQIKDDLSKYVEIYGKGKPMLCFPHSERICVYDEAGACLVSHKGKKEQIIEQITTYYQMGYPLNRGLYEMGCIVRNHNDDLVKRLMIDWEKEILRYSYRDQISFPFVCWKNSFDPDICDLSIRNNRFLSNKPHNKN